MAECFLDRTAEACAGERDFEVVPDRVLVFGCELGEFIDGRGIDLIESDEYAVRLGERRGSLKL